MRRIQRILPGAPATRAWWVCAAIVCAAAGPALAQSAQAFAVQGSLLNNSIFGSAFGGLQDGRGFEAQLRYTPSALSVGAGLQYTSHDVSDPSRPDLKIRLYGVFLEPRYRIRIASNNIAPYVSARLSVLKVGYSEGQFSLSSRFIQVNGGGGILLRLTPRVNLDLGATYGYNRLGEGTLKSDESSSGITLQPVSGSNVVARLGVAIGIGG